MTVAGCDAKSREVLTLLTVGEASLAAVVQTLLLRRADIVSLTASRTCQNDRLRIQVVVNVANPGAADLLVRQLDRNVDVVSVERAPPETFHLRRGILVRLRADRRARDHVLGIATHAGADVIGLTPSEITVALFADPEQVDALLEALRPFGVHEVTDTGSIVIGRATRHHPANAARESSRHGS